MSEEKALWDALAGDYQAVFRLGINDYNAGLLRFFQKNGMIRPGCRVLDIGCGVGKYGTYLAALGCDVTLTDISGEMLRRAAENMAKFDTPQALYECDFNEVTGDEPVFAGGFDLVISTMSPAVHDTETVRKMSRLSQGWCFLSRFESWEQPVRDELMRRMGIEPRLTVENLDDDIASLIRAVEEAGFKPLLKHVRYNWSDRRSPEEMADYLCRRYFEDNERERYCSSALATAKNMAGEAGFIEDAVNTTVTWIYWKTK